jgi:ABC-type nitrate/sulfonate/bicarbonate transport system substrate-binding protein
MCCSRLLALVVLVVVTLGAWPLAAGEPVRLRVGWVVPITDWALFMVEKRDLAHHFGTSYVLEPVRFASSPSVITALANNELEIGNLAFSTLALAIKNGGLQDLRVIADLFQDGRPNYYSNEFFVRRDSTIESVRDLKGKVIATPGIGGAIDIAMRVMLRKHGLKDKRDYSVVEAPMPAMKALLAERKADLVPGVPPFAFDPELRGLGRILFTQNEALGLTQMIVLAARRPFLQQNRAALVDFLEDNLRLVRWCLDDANHDRVVAIAAKLTKQPPERFADWLFKKGDYYRDPDMLPDLKALQTNIDLQREVGLLREAIDVHDNVDLSLIKEAAHRLN